MQALDHDALDRMRQTHPAWRLLAADHAPLLLGFFDAAFIRPNRRAIPAAELIAFGVVREVVRRRGIEMPAEN